MRPDHDRFKRLQYLKAVARVQHEYRDWLGKTDQKLLLQGLRVDDLRGAIKTVKQQQHSYRSPFRRRKASEVNYAIQALMAPNIGARTIVEVRVGKRVWAEKSKGYHMIDVGYMWLYKVFKPLYQDTKRYDYKNWLILSADRVRVNSKSLILFEVKAYNHGTGQVATGYVAQAKDTEQKQSAFGLTAIKAMKATEQLMSDDINKVMGIN